MIAIASHKGICLLEFENRRALPTEIKFLIKHFNAEITDSESPFFPELRLQLNAYFTKDLQQFSIPLDTPGTAFQNTVWKELQAIPYGKTRSYKQQSIALGQPLAIRAVANANGMNRIAILIPCHRVIGEDGSMTGYGGKIWRKKWLLELESASGQGSLFETSVERNNN
jgi:AraC family transcriptional regulator, regulatory protein of adaptative response / methylated-DNA-[protein]-cysteine methyltransferase